LRVITKPYSAYGLKVVILYLSAQSLLLLKYSVDYP